MKLVPMMIATAIAMTAAAGITLSGDVAQAANDTNRHGLVERSSSKSTDRQTREAERQRQATDWLTKRLDQAVADGKITSAQKDLALKKHAEVQAQMEAIRNLTDETARDEARDKVRDDLEKWAEANGMAASIMQPYHGSSRHHMGMMRAH